MLARGLRQDDAVNVTYRLLLEYRLETRMQLSKLFELVVMRHA